MLCCCCCWWCECEGGKASINFKKKFCYIFLFGLLRQITKKKKNGVTSLANVLLNLSRKKKGRRGGGGKKNFFFIYQIKNL